VVWPKRVRTEQELCDWRPESMTIFVLLERVIGSVKKEMVLLLIERLKIVEQEKICKVPLFSLFYDFALLQILFFRKGEKALSITLRRVLLLILDPFPIDILSHVDQTFLFLF
jgi:hypothetical protein